MQNKSFSVIRAVGSSGLLKEPRRGGMFIAPGFNRNPSPVRGDMYMPLLRSFGINFRLEL
jgi:hypothetical protein